MMGDEGWARAEFEAYAAYVIDSLVPVIRDSAVTVSIVPSGTGDVKFAIELGLSIMLDKPIILAVMPGVRVPEHLARVADGVIEFDPDDPDATGAQIAAVMKRLNRDE
jgi:hypothetical protein